MKLDKEKIWQNANVIYGHKKLIQMGRKPEDFKYLAPEQIPTIVSNQVRAIMEAIVDEINDKGMNPPMTPEK
jgi:hypothetical protein